MAALNLPAAIPASLVIADNQRFLTTSTGEPFFYLGDTAWELFHRLNREEAGRYLEDRAAKGFTVIQAVALAELNGLVDPNAYGHLPLIDGDPSRPDVREGADNDYWDHVDHIVEKANSLGLIVGFLPTWGDKWNRKWGLGPEIFTPENAAWYGEWLGRRYRDARLIWIVGGDRPVETEGHRRIIESMALGLRRGDGGRHLITFHPSGASGSAQFFPDAEWLDFNMRQTSHHPEFSGRYDQTRADYDRIPVKPVIDGEPLYEDIPIDFKAETNGHATAADVRRPLYWNLFSGAFGHTYGNNSVWQMWSPERHPVLQPLMPWDEAIHQPGAGQMRHGRDLLESRPFLTRIPDDSIIVPDRVPTAIPGAGRYRFVGTRDLEGTYAMVYAPVGRTFRVRTEAIAGSEINAWWFNPRDGSAFLIETFRKEAVMAFTPPDRGELLDWILVLDDASRGYPPPGRQ